MYLDYINKYPSPEKDFLNKVFGENRGLAKKVSDKMNITYLSVMHYKSGRRRISTEKFKLIVDTINEILNTNYYSNIADYQRDISQIYIKEQQLVPILDKFLSTESSLKFMFLLSKFPNLSKSKLFGETVNKNELLNAISEYENIKNQ